MWTWPGSRRWGAKAPSRSFLREARGASCCAAPQHALANPGVGQLCGRIFDPDPVQNILMKDLNKTPFVSAQKKAKERSKLAREITGTLENLPRTFGSFRLLAVTSCQVWQSLKPFNTRHRPWALKYTGRPWNELPLWRGMLEHAPEISCLWQMKALL